jgi:HPt (histidine-containing phosphotransfer) domain-containing protein
MVIPGARQGSLRVGTQVETKPLTPDPPEESSPAENAPTGPVADPVAHGALDEGAGDAGEGPLAAIQARFGRAAEARVRVLERAARALMEGRLDTELRDRGAGEAHKLAGSLGMFGVSEGSRLAAEIEAALSSGLPLSGQDGDDLRQLVRELRGQLRHLGAA